MADESEVRLIIKAIDETKAAFSSIDNNLKRLQGAASAIKTAFQGFVAYLAVDQISAGIKKLIDIFDDFNTTIAQTAALWTTFTKIPAGKTPGEVYKQWRDYAEEVYEKLTEIDAQILGTRQQAMEMVGVFAQHGQVIDVNNQKQLTGLRNIINAVQILTQGQNQEIQIRQEINALLNGTLNQNSRLIQLLSNIDPQIKEHLKAWQEEGVAVEKVGELLKGFDVAASDLENIFQAQKTTLQSIVSDILRKGFEPILKDIVAGTKALIGYLQNSKDIFIKALNDISSIWEFIKRTIAACSPLLMDIWDILKTNIYPIVKIILSAFAYLGGTTLPFIATVLSNLWKEVKALALAAMAFGAALTFQFDLAKDLFNAAKESISEMKDPLEAYENGLKNVNQLMNELSKKEIGKGIERKGKPLFEVVPTKEVEKGKEDKYEKLLMEYNEFLKQLEVDSKEGYERDLAEIDKWQMEKINKLHEFNEKLKEFKKQEIKIDVEAEEEKIKAIAEAKRTDIYLKYMEERAQKEVEIENEITERSLDEYEKRKWAIDDWLDKTVEAIKEYVENAEEAERLITRAKEVANNEKIKIEEDYRNKLKELNLRAQEEAIKTAELMGNITPEESLKRQIDLYNEIIALLWERAEAEARANNNEAYQEILVSIENYKQKTIDVNNELRKYEGTFGEGIQQGMIELSNEIPTAFESGIDAIKNMISITEKALENFLDISSKNFMDFRNLILSIIKDIYKELVQRLILIPLKENILAYFKSSGIINWRPIPEEGVMGHTGGYIPKFHYGGLNSDEVFAILQRGEYVVSKKGVEFLNRINEGKLLGGNVNVVVNVENQTGIPVKAEQKAIEIDPEKYVIGVVLKNLETSPSFRKTIAGVR